MISKNTHCYHFADHTRTSVHIWFLSAHYSGYLYLLRPQSKNPLRNVATVGVQQTDRLAKQISITYTPQLLSTNADRQGVDMSSTVCLCVCLYGYGFLH